MKTMLLYLFSLLLLCTVTAAGHHQSYETIYVHTDRCNFCAGDTVWFQVYVMDTRQQAESYSHFVYAELLHDTIRMATEKNQSRRRRIHRLLPITRQHCPGPLHAALLHPTFSLSSDPLHPGLYRTTGLLLQRRCHARQFPSRFANADTGMDCF